MKTERDTTRIVRSWLEIGADRLPDRVLDSVLEQLPAHRQRRRPLWRPWRSDIMNVYAKVAIAAAAVLVVAVIGYNLLPGVNGPASSPSPNPSPSATPRNFSTVVEGGTVLEPGTYAITVFPTVRIVFDVPSGWSKGRYDWAIFSETSSVSVAFVTVSDLIADPCAPEPTIRVPQLGTSAAALLAGLEDTPGIDVGAPTPTTLDGHSGQRLQVVMRDGWECAAEEPVLFDIPSLEPFPAPGPGEPISMWLVDVDGTRVVIAIQASNAESAIVTEAEAIVGNVRFE